MGVTGSLSPTRGRDSTCGDRGGELRYGDAGDSDLGGEGRAMAIRVGEAVENWENSLSSASECDAGYVCSGEALMASLVCRNEHKSAKFIQL